MSDKRQKILYFCDETSHVDDEFMAVGGIAVNTRAINEVEERIFQLRREFKISDTKEIKWSNVKARRDNVHRGYANLLRELVVKGRIHLHVRFQRMSDWNHDMAGPRKKTDTVSRAYYQLLLHRPVAFYGPQADIVVRPDNGDCTEKLHEYLPHLNTDARRKKGCKTGPVRSIDCQDSSRTPCLQLLDVTLGGLASLRNSRHLRPEISNVKRELAVHIHSVWGNTDLSRSSDSRTRKFNVWNAQPRKFTVPHN